MTELGIVGAGIIGLATALAARERGLSVTVYERGVPGNGQSGGDSRIFRHAHADPRLVALAQAARAGWRRWEERFGVDLLVADGVVVLGPGAADRLPILLAAGVPARMVDDVIPHFPLVRPPEAHPTAGLVDEQGGVIRTKAALTALLSALADAVVADEVLAVRPTGDGVEVRAGGLTALHDRVVVCAGRGTAELARGAGIEIPVEESVHARLTFPVRGEPPARLACLIDTSAGAYGDPLPGNDRYAIGIGDTDQPGLAAEAERTVAYVADHLPGHDPTPVGVRHCWVTDLPWGHDGLGVWEAGGARFLAGNNLFKHAPALGAALAAETLPEDLSATAHLGSGPSRGAPKR